MPSLIFLASPSNEEPLGQEVVKSWGGDMYHGICLETFTDTDNSKVTRTFWNDGYLHDLNESSIQDATTMATGHHHPNIKIKLYDESVYDIFVTPKSYKDEEGNIILQYKNREEAGSVDMRHPLTMSIARTNSGVLQSGMVLARISGITSRHDKFRVIFESGPGTLVSKQDLIAMRNLYIESDNSRPVVVEVESS